MEIVLQVGAEDLLTAQVVSHPKVLSLSGIMVALSLGSYS